MRINDNNFCYYRYEWEGKIQEDPELLLVSNKCVKLIKFCAYVLRNDTNIFTLQMIKTRTEKIDALTKYVK